MIDVTEAWSGPWHALQRTLAQDIAGCSVVAASADYRTARKTLRAPGATPPPRSWLREAHARGRGAATAGAK